MRIDDGRGKPAMTQSGPCSESFCRRPVSPQHEVGRERKPEGEFADQGNVREHRDDGETDHDERNVVYAENVQHGLRFYNPTHFDSSLVINESVVLSM